MDFSSLKKDEEFKRVYHKGKSFANRQFVLYYYKNGTESSRVGFSISKKYGKATARNKLRRRMKEILRSLEGVRRGYDFVWIARSGAKEADYKELRHSIRHLFRKTKMIR